MAKEQELVTGLEKIAILAEVYTDKLTSILEDLDKISGMIHLDDSIDKKLLFNLENESDTLDRLNRKLSKLKNLL